MLTVRVEIDDFNQGQEIAALQKKRTDIGAIVTFTGTVRDMTGTLTSLTLEHYPGMTKRELERIGQDAITRWNLLGCTIIHRYGTLKPGENIVLVITTAPHRGDAFKAAEYIMDYLKTSAPFWKKETTKTDSTWVDAKDTDDQAKDRWS
ncbi:molybdenum cofactor biosynthesis protein MoaE [Kordiimonas sediminis]|uniref:Molybdopterin synthase catalytic subunit n=1 Tax=Kordiimonas sediminis TaxID=1735581 RepID=A0A919ATC2_9PROT|nr:molybdenum cofactor biosynthesis protein MoaE [Kordiimonas sediminis]GHF23184.1 molybdenum cofactor biosynthesis protein MoaE [Kordiimonas sediminis]